VRGLFGGLAIVALVSGALGVLAVQSPNLSAQSGPSAARATTSDVELPREPASKTETVRWRLASQFPVTLPETGTLLAEIAGRIEMMSHGAVRIDITEPKDVAQPLELFNAVAGGAFDAAFIWPATIKARTAAFEIYGGIPFGPKAGEFLTWHEKSGRSLRDELYRAHNLHGLLCGMVASGGTWFRGEVKSAADIDRMPVAAFGLAARTLTQFGAHPVAIAPAAIGRAYKDHKIVGAALLSPVVDRQIMRGSTAKRYAFPSWSQHWAGLDLIVNLDVWQALPARHRVTVESVCTANLASSFAASEAAQYDVLKGMIKDGVDVRRLPASMVAALRTAWTEVNDGLQRDDPEFRRVWVSLTAFRESHALWRELTDASPAVKP